MSMNLSHEQIIEILRAEALDDRDTGWLSDMNAYPLEYEDGDWAISTGNGSIDLSHLASIFQGILEGDYR